MKLPETTLACVYHGPDHEGPTANVQHLFGDLLRFEQRPLPKLGLGMLMSVDKPSAGVKRAVIAGASWYESAMIEGHRHQKGKTGPALVVDAAATGCP